MKVRLMHAIAACIICFLAGLMLMFFICEKEIWYWNIRKKQKELNAEIQRLERGRPLIKKETENLILKFGLWTNELERILQWDEPRYEKAELEEVEEKGGEK